MKFNPQRVATVLASIDQGLSLSRASVMAGMTRETVSEWVRQKPEFGQQVAEAETRFMMRLLNTVQSGAETNPKLALELLSRRFPQEFARPAAAHVQIANTIEVEKSQQESEATITQRMSKSPAAVAALRRYVERVEKMHEAEIQSRASR